MMHCDLDNVIRLTIFNSVQKTIACTHIAIETTIFRSLHDRSKNGKVSVVRV